MRGHTFISYARADETYVSSLARYLRELSVEVWTDAAIEFGAEWPPTLRAKIDSCAAFILVMSPEAEKSAWVRREILRAQEQRKPIFPLLLAGEVLFEVSDLHYEDVRGGRMPSPRWVDRLVADRQQWDLSPTQRNRQRLAERTPAHLVRQATARPQAISISNPHRVWSVAFSPDGTTLASASQDKTIRLWDVATRHQITTLNGHTGPVWSVAFSPDGTTLASASEDRTVRVSDAVSGRQIAAMVGHNARVGSVSFSPASTRLASGSLDGTVRLWDAASGRQIISLDGRSGPVVSVVFSPDGASLASGGLVGVIKMWEVTSHRQIASLEGHTSAVRSMAFSPSSHCIASGSEDRTIRLWTLAR